MKALKKSFPLVLVISLLIHLSVAFAQEGEHKHSKGQRHQTPFSSLEEYIQALESPDRAKWQRPDKVIEALGIKMGQAIADLGAGSGYFTMPLSQAVGDEGMVYAIDIEKGMLDYINKRAEEAGIKNIKTILAKPDDPLLSPSTVDMVFICDTYHHIEDRIEYMKRLSRAFKEGGRLVIIDFIPQKTPVGPPLEIRLSREEVIKEIEAAGYRLEGEYNFLPYQYFLIFSTP